MSTMRTIDCTLQQHFYAPRGNVTPPRAAAVDALRLLLELL
jgi:hypothetical protein